VIESNKKGTIKKLVSRRDFLMAGGAVIAAGALSACTPKTSTETVVSTLTNTKTVTNTATVTAPAVTATVTGAPVTTTVTKTVAPTSITLLNPRASINPPKTMGISPRPTTLAGKRIAFVDIGKAGYKEYLDVLIPLFQAKFPTATITRYGGAFDIGDAIAATIAKENDMCFYGSAD